MTRNCKRCKKIISPPRIYCATCQTVEDGDDLLGLPIVVDFSPAFVADSDGGTAHDTSSSDSSSSDSGSGDGGCGSGDGGGGGGD